MNISPLTIRQLNQTANKPVNYQLLLQIVIEIPCYLLVEMQAVFACHVVLVAGVDEIIGIGICIPLLVSIPSIVIRLLATWNAV